MNLLNVNSNNINFYAKNKKFDCNYKNKNGVAIFEQAIKSESAKFLPYFYLPDEDIIFTQGMLDAYKNIKNPEYKKEIEKSEKIFMRFPELESAIKENNPDGIRKGIQTLSECKFCNRFHTLYLLAATLLKDYDSIESNFSRSIEFVKSAEKFMPEVFKRFYTRFSDTQNYILTIKRIIKNS